MEELRSSTALDDLIDSLRSDWWDKPRMRAALASRRAHESAESMHPITDQFLKIYTVDRLTI